MRTDTTAVSQIAWLPVYNDSGETIPAFAAMQISGIQSDGSFTVAKPNTNDAVANILFNGPVEIESEESGMGTYDMPVSVLYDTADGTPSVGADWGVASGGWKLKLARTGFLIQGVIDSSAGIASAVRASSNAFTTQEVDGSPSTTTTLKFPNTSLTDNGDGTVTVKSADATHAGLMSTASQTLEGEKTFLDTIFADNATGSSNPAIVLSQAVKVYQDSDDLVIAEGGSSPAFDYLRVLGRAFFEELIRVGDPVTGAESTTLGTHYLEFGNSEESATYPDESVRMSVHAFDDGGDKLLITFGPGNASAITDVRLGVGGGHSPYGESITEAGITYTGGLRMSGGTLEIDGGTW